MIVVGATPIHAHAGLDPVALEQEERSSGSARLVGEMILELMVGCVGRLSGAKIVFVM